MITNEFHLGLETLIPKTPQLEASFLLDKLSALYFMTKNYCNLYAKNMLLQQGLQFGTSHVGLLGGSTCIIGTIKFDTKKIPMKF